MSDSTEYTFFNNTVEVWMLKAKPGIQNDMFANISLRTK